MGAEDVPLRRNREFNLLWGGQVLSDLGARISGLAFPLLVLAITFPQIMFVALAEGVGFVFFNIAERSALPKVPPADQLPGALSRNQVREYGVLNDVRCHGSGSEQGYQGSAARPRACRSPALGRRLTGHASAHQPEVPGASIRPDMDACHIGEPDDGARGLVGLLLVPIRSSFLDLGAP
jgi:hypothetical protein